MCVSDNVTILLLTYWQRRAKRLWCSCLSLKEGSLYSEGTLFALKFAFPSRFLLFFFCFFVTFLCVVFVLLFFFFLNSAYHHYTYTFIQVASGRPHKGNIFAC